MSTNWADMANTAFAGLAALVAVATLLNGAARRSRLQKRVSIYQAWRAEEPNAGRRAVLDDLLTLHRGQLLSLQLTPTRAYAAVSLAYLTIPLGAMLTIAPVIGYLNSAVDPSLSGYFDQPVDNGQDFLWRSAPILTMLVMLYASGLPYMQLSLVWHVQRHIASDYGKGLPIRTTPPFEGFTGPDDVPRAPDGPRPLRNPRAPRTAYTSGLSLYFGAIALTQALFLDSPHIDRLRRESAQARDAISRLFDDAGRGNGLQVVNTDAYQSLRTTVSDADATLVWINWLTFAPIVLSLILAVFAVHCYDDERKDRPDVPYVFGNKLIVAPVDTRSGQRKN